MAKSARPRKREKSAAHKGRQPLTIARGFGEAVYEAMVRKRRPNGEAWTTRDLVIATGVSQNTATRWIAGKFPRGEKLAKLAEVLGVSADVLLRGDVLECQLVGLPAWAQESVRARRAALADRARVEQGLRDQHVPPPDEQRREGLA